MYVKENKETEEEFSRLQSELKDLKDKNEQLVRLLSNCISLLKIFIAFEGSHPIIARGS